MVNRVQLVTKDSVIKKILVMQKKFLCFQLQSGEKVWMGQNYVFAFLFFDIPCNIAQQIIEKQSNSEN